ncbi:MAG: hypothetical protein HS103_07840 [Anaerolineales bacterium]|nr:hypothetical protein [Anaerolineales bacterium]
MKRAADSTLTLLCLILAILGMALYTLSAARTGGVGFPLDDSWIHQTYARHLAQTGTWAFTPGIPSAGSTSPLYTVLLSLGYRLNVPYFLWAMALGAAALTLGAVVGGRMARRLFPELPAVSLWTGAALALGWHLVWAAASSMETMLFAALALLVIALALSQTDPAAERQRFLAGFLFGVIGAACVATRPEGLVCVGLSGLAMLIARPQRTLRELGFWLVGGALGGLIGLAPYFALNLSLTGSPFPNTLDAKLVGNAPLLQLGFFRNLAAMIEPLTAGGQFLLIPGLLWACAVLARRLTPRRVALHALPLVWSAALILLYVVRMPAPFHHGRYVIPALPPIFVLGIGGTFLLMRWASARRRSLPVRVVGRVLGIGAAALIVVFWGVGASVYGVDVWRINSDMVVAAQWVQANVPPDHLLAVNDIGAIGFFANSVEAPRPILDLAGLVSPEVIPLLRNPEGLTALMRARGVRYVMLLPTQWLDFWNGNPAPYEGDFCLRFDAKGGMGGMRLYEYRPGGC